MGNILFSRLIDKKGFERKQFNTGSDKSYTILIIALFDKMFNDEDKWDFLKNCLLKLILLPKLHYLVIHFLFESK